MTKTDAALFRTLFAILGLGLAALAFGCWLGGDPAWTVVVSAILSGNCFWVARRLL